MNNVLRNILITLTCLLTIVSAHAQEEARVLVSNLRTENGIQVRWITQNVVNYQGVNVYRRSTAQTNWVKLNQTPIKKLNNPSPDLLNTDPDYKMGVNMIDALSPSEIKGLILLATLKTAVLSQAYAEYIGIDHIDYTTIKGETYQYKVMRVKGNNEELLGTSPLITVGEFVPEKAPEELSATLNEYTANLKWKENTNKFFAYNVYRKTNDNEIEEKVNKQPVMILASSDGKGNYKLPDIYFQDDSLVVDNSYSYRVKGITYIGYESDFTNEAGVTVKDVTPPPSPKGIKAKANDDELKINLSWDRIDSQEIVWFEIYRGNNKNEPFQLINSNGVLPVTTYFVDKISKVGTYYYLLASVDDAGNKAFSDTFSVSINDVIPPNVPTGLKAQADSGIITLTWLANNEPDLYGYKLYRKHKKHGNKYILLTADMITSNSYSEKLGKNVKDGFIYRIAAFDTNYNKSKYSEDVSITLPDLIAPEKPVIKNVAQNENGIDIFWVPNVDGDLAGYNLYRTDTTGNTKKINTEIIVPGTTQFTDAVVNNTSLVTKYEYHIEAVDQNNNTSEPSGKFPVYIAAKETEVKLSNLKGSYKSGRKSIVLSWKSETNNLVGYSVLRKEGGGVFKPVSGMVKDENYTDTKIVLNKTYAYYVRAVYKSGKTIKSDIIELETK